MQEPIKTTYVFTWFITSSFLIFILSKDLLEEKAEMMRDIAKVDQEIKKNEKHLDRYRAWSTFYGSSVEVIYLSNPLGHYIMANIPSFPRQELSNSSLIFLNYIIKTLENLE